MASPPSFPSVACPGYSPGTPKPSLDFPVIRGSSLAWQGSYRTLEPALAYGHVYPQTPNPNSWWCQLFWCPPHSLILGVSRELSWLSSSWLSSRGRPVVSPSLSPYCCSEGTADRVVWGRMFSQDVSLRNRVSCARTRRLFDSHLFWSPSPCLIQAKNILQTNAYTSLCFPSLPLMDFPISRGMPSEHHRMKLLCKSAP